MQEERGKARQDKKERQVVKGKGKTKREIKLKTIKGKEGKGRVKQGTINESGQLSIVSWHPLGLRCLGQEFGEQTVLKQILTPWTQRGLLLHQILDEFLRLQWDIYRVV